MHFVYEHCSCGRYLVSGQRECVMSHHDILASAVSHVASLPNSVSCDQGGYFDMRANIVDVVLV